MEEEEIFVLETTTGRTYRSIFKEEQIGLLGFGHLVEYIYFFAKPSEVHS